MRNILNEQYIYERAGDFKCLKLEIEKVQYFIC